MKMKTFQLAATLLAFAAFSLFSCNTASKKSADTEEAETVQTEEVADFQLSLAQWSLHKTFYGGPISDWQTFGQKLMTDPDALLVGPDPMEFPAMAASYGIYCIELVNQFYMSKANDMEYWAQFKKKCEEAGVTVGLIMCDALGNLGDADPEVRKATVEKHHAWVDIAAFLGAHSIRVNAGGEGKAEEVAVNAADGLKMLGEYGQTKGINVIVENHGGYSSNGKWLSGVMEAVGMDNVGTLPDFGNFCIQSGPDGCVDQYDPYLGLEEIMPYAKGVSAKSHNFDAEGNETEKDYLRMMKIVKESGFKGYVGIEYEGSELSEEEGIKATKALLERVFAQL